MDTNEYQKWGNTHIKTAQKIEKQIYEAVRSLPIVDYHCHLSPKEIWEDRPYRNIYEMWLAHDHYKWRLMRAFGLEERLITGDASERDKFDAFLCAVETAVGHPVKAWAQMELAQFFGVHHRLSVKNADSIWEETQKAIEARRLSPRSILSSAGVEFVATTDDPADDLHYHQLLAKDASFGIRVTPTFRVDNLFNIHVSAFLPYLKKLGASQSVEIDSFDAFLQCIDARMQHFAANGCRFADIGIERFPERAGTYEQAQALFAKALAGELSCTEDTAPYLDYLYRWWLGKCKEYGFIAQMHLGVLRNANTHMFEKLGPDSGFDIPAEPVAVFHVRRVLDAVTREGKCPDIILYTLNPNAYYPLITLADAFAGVYVGVPWWFNDHKRGIMTFFETFSELSHIGKILGMLTDSRSFLSYARHDYFRQILSEYLGRFEGEEETQTLINIAKDLSCFNIKRLIGLQ